MTLFVNDMPVSTRALDAAGQVTFTRTYPPGTHRLMASYRGSSIYFPSMSETRSLRVHAPPPNDLFANRIAITGPGTLPAGNLGATAEPGQPLVNVRPNYRLVWWSYTPSDTGHATVWTRSATAPRTLVVYRGDTLADLQMVTAVNISAGVDAPVTFVVSPGTAYQIASAPLPVGAMSDDITLSLGTGTATTFSGPVTGGFGQNLVFNASVSGAAGMPAGVVSFRRDGVEFAQGALDDLGVARVTTSGLPVGTHPISAEYRGNSVYLGSASAAQGLTIARAATTTTLAGPATASFGQGVSFFATVVSPGGPTGGTVSFRRDGVEFARGAVDATGVATGTTTGLPVGSHQITARLLGGANFAPSTSVARQIVIARASSVTALTAPASRAAGAGVGLRATVTSAGGVPGGQVGFRRDGVQFATVALNAQGVASTTTRDLPVGTSAITARYLGAAGFEPSTSAPRSVRITALNRSFRGGGAVFAQTEGCGPLLGTGPHAVTVSYSPAELNGLPSGVSIVWRQGAEHLALWGPMAPSGDFFGGAGRATWTRFVFYPTRPLVRVVGRPVTLPAGGHIADAQDLALRLRVQNFGAVAGCSVTAVAVMRRG